jgi:carnitine-CoA ligase
MPESEAKIMTVSSVSPLTTPAGSYSTHPFHGLDVNWLLATRAETRRTHPFLIWEPFVGPRRTWTYAQFRHDVLKLAAGLQARGVRAGERVLVHLDNAPELELAWFACHHIGAVIVTTNTRSAGPEIAYYTEASGAVAAITQPELASVVADHAKGIRWLAVTDYLADGTPANSVALPERALRFSALASGDPSTLTPLPADPMRPGSVQFTSGTTSRPKPVLWTHANALWGARQSAVHEGLRPDDVHQVVLPSFHTNARTYSILPTLWVGGTVVLQPRFSASRFWDVALRNKTTWHSSVPFCFKALSQQPQPDAHFIRMIGASANNPPFAAFFGVPVLGWWGMTETITQPIVGDAHMPNRPLTTGRPAAGYEIRIVDDDGQPVKPGETGHLHCRGTRGLQMFSEYMGNAQATADSFTADGWFLTGDRMTLLGDGNLLFADRDKDMLKVGGENVAASEIERVIQPVAGVREVAIVAQKHAMLDEVPVAFVIPDGDMPSDKHADLTARIMAACGTALADFKRPRAVHIVSEMPRSTLEKVNKAELRKGLPVLT